MTLTVLDLDNENKGVFPALRGAQFPPTALHELRSGALSAGHGLPVVLEPRVHLDAGRGARRGAFLRRGASRDSSRRCARRSPYMVPARAAGHAGGPSTEHEALRVVGNLVTPDGEFAPPELCAPGGDRQPHADGLQRCRAGPRASPLDARRGGRTARGRSGATRRKSTASSGERRPRLTGGRAMADWTPRRFEDRVALVTGGASGMGRETSVRLAREGAAVVVAGLPDDARGAETIAMIEAEGGRAVYVGADVSREAGLRRDGAGRRGRVRAARLLRGRGRRAACALRQRRDRAGGCQSRPQRGAPDQQAARILGARAGGQSDRRDADQPSGCQAADRAGAKAGRLSTSRPARRKFRCAAAPNTRSPKPAFGCSPAAWRWSSRRTGSA